MAWTFNPFSGTFDQKGSGGGGGASYIDGEVATYADLPLDGSAALNSAWLVRTASGVWPVSRKQAGIYIRTATGGSNNIQTVTYKEGGSGGQTVATLTFSYTTNPPTTDDASLASVTRS